MTQSVDAMKVRIGIGLGIRTRLHGPDFGPVVDEIERLGFDSLWLSERITTEAPDPIVGMAYAAGRTTRLKFGMSVLVLPGRNPVVLAKELATLSVMSGGRLLPAFGLGVADGAEHQAFGVRREERARWFDEALTVMRACWRDDVVDHDGERFHYEGLRVQPKPKRLDVWLGGIAPSELRRVGRLADGWLPSFVTPADAAAGRAVVEQVAAEHDRSIEEDHYGVLIPYAFGLGARPPARPAGPPAPGPRRSCRADPRRLGRASRHDQALRRRRHDEVRRASRHRARRRRRLANAPRRGGRGAAPPRDRRPAQRSSAAIAALRPGIPDTPPPRRAPAPHTNTLACAVSTPHRPSSDGDPRRRATAARRDRCARPEVRGAPRAPVGPSPRRTPAPAGSPGSAPRAPSPTTRARPRRQHAVDRRGRPGTAAPAGAARTPSASARRQPATPATGSTDRATSGSRPRTARRPGCDRRAPADTPARAGRSPR